MAGSSVVFLKDWVVDDGGGHDDLRLPIANCRLLFDRPRVN
jgi:hypothetical protein